MKFKSETANERLNDILTFLNTKYAEPIISDVIAENVVEYDNIITQEYLNEVMLMLKFLISEKYIQYHEVDNPNLYFFYITFPGKKFIEDGGYVKQAERENVEIARAKKIDFLMGYGAMIAGIFSFLYFGWTVFVYGHERWWWYCLFHHCCHCH